MRAPKSAKPGALTSGPAGLPVGLHAGHELAGGFDVEAGAEDVGDVAELGSAVGDD